jgi:hypothetical protein
LDSCTGGQRFEAYFYEMTLGMTKLQNTMFGDPKLQFSPKFQCRNEGLTKLTIGLIRFDDV